MTRRLKASFPKPLADIANQEYAGKVTSEVEWPTEVAEVNTDAEPQTISQAVITDGRSFNFTHVIQDRLRPRQFSTLGHKILIECPQCGALCGDERGYRNHRRNHEMIIEFIEHFNLVIGGQ